MVQCDCLSIPRGTVAEVREACARGDAAEALETADFLLADLDAILERYTDALHRHGIERPF